MEKQIKPKDWIKLEPFAVINKLGLHYDISTAEIAEKAGYDRPQAFYDVMSGKTKKISPKMAEKIKKAFPDINEDWLITGKGNMLVEENCTENTEIFTGYYLPEVSASAGLETSINNDELKKIPVTIPGWEKDIIFINVFGDSMYPKFNSGEVIGVKYVEFQYLNYGYPYVVVFNDGEVFIKIIQPGKDEEHLVLESVNVFYKPKEFHKSLIKSFYSIKGVIKKEMM